MAALDGLAPVMRVAVVVNSNSLGGGATVTPTTTSMLSVPSLTVTVKLSVSDAGVRQPTAARRWWGCS